MGLFPWQMQLYRYEIVLINERVIIIFACYHSNLHFHDKTMRILTILGMRVFHPIKLEVNRLQIFEMCSWNVYGGMMKDRNKKEKQPNKSNKSSTSLWRFCNDPFERNVYIEDKENSSLLSLALNSYTASIFIPNVHVHSFNLLFIYCVTFL